jgi:hypothetical protein
LLQKSASNAKKDGACQGQADVHYVKLIII